MNSVIELLELIKARPTMYLTRNYISCLKAFLDGWYFRNPNDLPDSYVMEEFQNWIVDKYRINTSHSWADILLFYSSDESTALKLFFAEFEEWKSLHLPNNSI